MSTSWVPLVLAIPLGISYTGLQARSARADC